VHQDARYGAMAMILKIRATMSHSPK
jgi:hypothetical protein